MQAQVSDTFITGQQHARSPEVLSAVGSYSLSSTNTEYGPALNVAAPKSDIFINPYLAGMRTDSAVSSICNQAKKILSYALFH